MTRGGKPRPLYRKVNTRTHNVRHGQGGEARWDRNTKAAQASDAKTGKMRQGLRHGLDYSPLYKFLLSKVGQDWDAVHSAALARLDHEDPIWHIVARSETDKRPYVRTGESSYFSGLYVDHDNRLQLVDPGFTRNDLKPSCGCCTHTLNGQVVTRRYQRPEAD